MEQNNSKLNTIPTAILIAGALIAGAVIIRDDGAAREAAQQEENTPSIVKEVAREVSFALPFTWGDLGQRMVSVGVIDREKFLALYAGTDREIARRFLDETIDEPVVISEKNAGIMLNLLWAAGLGNKSAILEKGPMMDKRYAGAGPPASGFASTAGWTVSDGNPMDHYSRHPLMMLTPEQEALVGRVAKNIYRPCCDNATHFPDCNHGMAMLGLLELMAAEGRGEEELYDAALSMNRLWFPAQYEAIDRYVAEKDIKKADAETLLSSSYASASGFQRIVQSLEATPAQQKGGGSGGGCSV